MRSSKPKTQGVGDVNQTSLEPGYARTCLIGCFATGIYGTALHPNQAKMHRHVGAVEEHYRRSAMPHRVQQRQHPYHVVEEVPRGGELSAHAQAGQRHTLMADAMTATNTKIPHSPGLRGNPMSRR
jgi:hypothetical protein